MLVVVLWDGHDFICWILCPGRMMDGWAVATLAPLQDDSV